MVKLSPKDALSLAMHIMEAEKEQSWPGLKAKLEAQDVAEALGAEGLFTLMEAFLARATATLPDKRLAEELSFWADGGTYTTHLQGFQAIPPRALVKEAEKRGWLVKTLPQKTLVSPPEGKPLALTTLLVEQG